MVISFVSAKAGEEFPEDQDYCIQGPVSSQSIFQSPGCFFSGKADRYWASE